MGMMDGYMKGVFLMGGMAQPRQRMQPVSDNHDEVIELLKEKRAWRRYAVTLKASLEAERQAEADVIAELKKLDPENPLADHATVKALQSKYYDARNGEDVTARADQQVKEGILQK